MLISSKRVTRIAEKVELLDSAPELDISVTETTQHCEKNNYKLLGFAKRFATIEVKTFTKGVTAETKYNRRNVTV